MSGTWTISETYLPSHLAFTKAVNYSTTAITPPLFRKYVNTLKQSIDFPINVMLILRPGINLAASNVNGLNG
jgi:hypothetical protein